MHTTKIANEGEGKSEVERVRLVSKTSSASFVVHIIRIPILPMIQTRKLYVYRSVDDNTNFIFVLN
jgi:hypothetical protein